MAISAFASKVHKSEGTQCWSPQVTRSRLFAVPWSWGTAPGSSACQGRQQARQGLAGRVNISINTTTAFHKLQKIQPYTFHCCHWSSASLHKSLGGRTTSGSFQKLLSAYLGKPSTKSYWRNRCSINEVSTACPFFEVIAKIWNDKNVYIFCIKDL